MDERNSHRLRAADGGDAELASTAVPRSDPLADQPVAPEGNSTVVFCGDAETIHEGFSLALSLMQASSNLLLPEIAPPAGDVAQEDT
jgi:hypothetical protein